MFGLRRARFGLFGLFHEGLIVEVEGEFILFESVVALATVIDALQTLSSLLIAIDLILVVGVYVSVLVRGGLGQGRRCGHLLLRLQIEKVVIVVEHEVKCFHIIFLLIQFLN